MKVSAKKIFISMPMAGKSKEEILQVQHDVAVATANKLNEDVELIVSYVDEELTPLGCLSESLKLMAMADYVVFADGWEDARGCQIEMACVKAYDIPYLYANKMTGGDENGG